MQLPIDWPARGAIEIRNLEVRYSKGLDPALHGVTASVNSGEKVQEYAVYDSWCFLLAITL